jgi:Fe-S-cluster containining protein
MILETIFVVLSGLILVAVALVVRSAFRGERDATEQTKSVLAWRPPFMRGDALRNWAADGAEQLAQNRLSGERTGQAVVQLAVDLEEGAARAMLPLARQAELERVVECPENGQGTIGVTVPEALALAAHLRKTKSKAELEQIYELAVESSKDLALGARAGFAPLKVPCTLEGEDGVCRAFEARPLGCRPFHAGSVALGMGSRDANAPGSEKAAPGQERHEQTVAHGIELGLARALKSAGLDANVYELNSALARALQSPDAAARYAKGENVFEGCRRLSPKPA